MLKVESLTAGYHDKVILKNVSLTIPEGKITALIGPNGCGKSTLLKTFSRSVKPSSGSVSWQGKNINEFSHRDYSKIISLLPQVQPIPEGITVYDLVSYGRSPHNGFWGRLTQKDRSVMNEMMQATGVHELQDHLVSELSGGQRQRVWLAMTLAQETPCLLLDEPTTYMDLNHQVELLNQLGRLKKSGKTVVTVLHDINQAARYCDYLIVMKDGQLVAEGVPSDVVSEQLLADVFSVKTKIFSDPIASTPMCVVDDF